MLIPLLIIYVTCLALSVLSKSQGARTGAYSARTGAYIAVVVMHILVAILPTCFWISDYGVLLGLAMGAAVLGISLLVAQGARFVIR